MSGFAKLSVEKARGLAEATQKRIKEVREQLKQQRIANIQANREWWRKYIPWLKPLTLEQAEQAYQVKKQNHWTWGDEYYAESLKSLQVLLLCQHSEDGFVYLMPELLGAINDKAVI